MTGCISRLLCGLIISLPYVHAVCPSVVAIIELVVVHKNVTSQDVGIIASSQCCRNANNGTKGMILHI